MKGIEKMNLNELMNEKEYRHNVGFKVRCVEWDSSAKYDELVLLAEEAMEVIRHKVLNTLDWFSIDKLVSTTKPDITQLNLSYDFSNIVTIEVMDSFGDMGATIRLTYWEGFQAGFDNDPNVKEETDCIENAVTQVFQLGGIEKC